MQCAITYKVPTGMLCDGFLRSPLKLAPSMMPVAMGKMIANILLKSHFAATPFEDAHCGLIDLCIVD